MRLTEKLERRFGSYAIPNLTIILVASQSLCYILVAVNPEFIRDLVLAPRLVINGEFWRVLTFMITPPHSNPIFVFFALYIFYLMGTSLEEKWGIFRYNLYIFIAYIATLFAVFIGPGGIATNFYIESSVFLAFAYLYPNYEFLLFLILPLKVKYLAMFTWGLYAVTLLTTNSDSERMLILASITNFAIFFGVEIKDNIKARQRRVEFDAKQGRQRNRTLHKCEICGVTEQVDADMEFRVCSQCSDGSEYCLKHIRDHEHA